MFIIYPDNFYLCYYEQCILKWSISCGINQYLYDSYQGIDYYMRGIKLIK